jgi:hypothetical protein
MRDLKSVEMETVLEYTRLMLTRRGYVLGEFIDTDIGGDDPGTKPRLYVTKPDNKRAVVFFVNKKVKGGDKITINVLKNIISLAKEEHIIIVHNTVLTSDAKQNMTNSNRSFLHRINTSLFQFETFTFDELSYDYFEVFENEPNVTFVQKQIPDANKFPILLSSDPLARYLGIQNGDIVQGKFGDKMITIRRCVNAL